VLCCAPPSLSSRVQDKFGSDRIRAEEIGRIAVAGDTGEVFVVNATGDSDDDSAIVQVFSRDGNYSRTFPRPKLNDAGAVAQAAAGSTSPPAAIGVVGSELWLAIDSAIVVLDRSSGALVRRLVGQRSKWSAPTAFTIDAGAAPPQLWVAGDVSRLFVYHCKPTAN
jgi:hypothetical protein